MSRTINRIELLGRVGTDPELRQTKQGTAVCRLRLATDRRNGSGDAQTNWHNLVVWGKTAEAVAEYVRKGDRIYVSGRLGYDSWEDQDGQRRQTTEVHANEVVFLDSRNSSSQPPTRAGGNGRRNNHDGDQPF
ncbi:MAG: single-stranded DNA-binding protein [Chloroflexi bacterium]|nr:single-stranded DNA-binding protein [Chloroflexota bacterium]